jgi:hypothetical protein
MRTTGMTSTANATETAEKTTGKGAGTGAGTRTMGTGALAQSAGGQVRSQPLRYCDEGLGAAKIGAACQKYSAGD